MSKSLGNFFTVRDLLNRYSSAPYFIPNMGLAIRLRFLQTSYRDPIDMTDNSLEQAATWLGRAYRALDDVQDLSKQQVNAVLKNSGFIEALADGLNTHLAVKLLQDQIKISQHRTEAVENPVGDEIYKDDELKFDEDSQTLLKAMLQFLGFELAELRQFDYQSRQVDLRSNVDHDVEKLIDELLQARQEARKLKNFQRADELRDGFKSAGLIVKDTSEGPTWEFGQEFDPSKLEALK